MQRERRVSPVGTPQRPPAGPAPAAGQPAQLLRLQRAIGNRATTRLLQRDGEVNLLDPAKESWVHKNTGANWSDHDKWIADFQTIQKCMTDRSLYEPALLKLAEAVKRERRSTEPVTDDGPLDRALLAMERKHNINMGGAPIYTRTLSADVFIEMSRQAVIATDPGAGSNHGAYTHRIQWYVVMTYAGRLYHKPAELVIKAVDPAVTPPLANWPQEARTATGDVVPIAEIRTTMWDALFDRTVSQMFPDLFRMEALGLSHPEVFTKAVVDSRLDGFEHVAVILADQYQRRWGGGGGAADAARTEAPLTEPGHRRHREGVYFRNAPAPAPVL